MPGSVAADAEKGRVAEGQHAGVAEQQVEADRDTAPKIRMLIASAS